MRVSVIYFLLFLFHWLMIPVDDRGSWHAPWSWFLGLLFLSRWEPIPIVGFHFIQMILSKLSLIHSVQDWPINNFLIHNQSCHPLQLHSPPRNLLLPPPPPPQLNCYSPASHTWLDRSRFDFTTPSMIWNSSSENRGNGYHRDDHCIYHRSPSSPSRSFTFGLDQVHYQRITNCWWRSGKSIITTAKS